MPHPLLPALLARLGLGEMERHERIGAEFGATCDVYRVRTNVRSVVVKICASCGEREITFFERFGTQFAGLPRFLGAEQTETARLLVFEEVHGRQGDALIGCDRTDAVAALLTLAYLHHHFESALPEGFPVRSCFNADQLARAVPALAAFREEFDGPAFLDGLPARAEAIDRCLDTGPQTLIHADFHLDNLMFTPEPVILDWQTACIAAPEIDLTRFFMEGLTNPQREAHGGDALAAWTRVMGRTPDPARIRASLHRTAVYVALAYARPGFGEALGSRAPALRVAGARRLLAMLEPEA